MRFALADNRIRSLVSLSRRAFGDYKSHVVLLTIFGFASGILEGVGVNALIPLFSFTLGTQTHSDGISLFIERFFGVFRADFTVMNLLIFIGVLFTLKAVVQVYLEFIKFNITYDFEERMRSRLFLRVVKANWSHLMRQKLGHLETVLMLDVPASANLLNQVSGSIMIITGLLMYVVVALNISYYTTLLTLAVGGVTFLIVKPLIYRTKVLSQQNTDLTKLATHHVTQNIIGVKTVKSMDIADSVSQAASDFFKKLRTYGVRKNVLKTVTTAFVQPIGLIFITILFGITYRSPDFNFAALIAVVYLIQRIFTYIQQLQRTLHNIGESLPNLQSALDFEAAASAQREVDTGSRAFSFQKSLEFRNVAFSYDNGRNVFENLSFAIAKGSMVGIIGPSGVGKTTLVDLCLRLLAPVSGLITLDDTDIAEISLRDWRKHIGYVSQDLYLMNDSILNNIRLYDYSISESDLVDAARKAQIDDYVQTLPERYNSVIGDRGVRLSAGQRQRIVIARILARKPELIILDEATSALDTESEMRVQSVMSALKGRVTVLVIAHRLSTVMESDSLLVLDDGRIIEQGAPRELLKNKDSYFFRLNNISNFNSTPAYA